MQILLDCFAGCVIRIHIKKHTGWPKRDTRNVMGTGGTKTTIPFRQVGDSGRGYE